MAGWQDVTNVWKNLREFDLRPLREAAERETNLVLVGARGVGKHTLAMQLRSDPARLNATTQTPITIVELDAAERGEALASADLVILMTDATASDFSSEQNLARQLADSGKKVLVLNNKLDLVRAANGENQIPDWIAARVLYGSALDRKFLANDFARAAVALLPEAQLSLGRHLPLFRVPIARDLINETSNANAIYSFTTGLAETVPVFDVPLNLGDMLVLTKAQALLVYKLGLLLGYSTDWQAHLAEFGGVIGGGFVWRQLARQLVGLIPVWGIVPKVAVAYAGTYAVGHTVLQWYLTGRKISGKQMRDLYAQALEQGKTFAKSLVAKAPRPRFPSFPRRRKPLALPARIKKNPSDE